MEEDTRILDIKVTSPEPKLSKKIADKVPRELHQKYQDQIHHELEVLEKCGYLEYFLMTEDFISWARSQGIRIGIGTIFYRSRTRWKACQEVLFYSV